MALDLQALKGKSLVRKALSRVGMDRAVAYAAVGRTWSSLAGAISLYFVARHLSPVEQGFYYTFSSVVGLQVFFELGLAYVLMQFASHEKAKLHWDSDGAIYGDPEAKERLASLLRLALRWYGVIAVLIILCVMPAGIAFFATSPGAASGVAWLRVWIWLSLAEASLLYVNPILSIIEGCGLVANVAGMRAMQGILANAALWLVLYCGGGLYAAPANTTVMVLVAIGWIAFTKRTFVKDLLCTSSTTGCVNWRAEVWPFQWKIAVSWLAGYFIFSLFTPLLFAFAGPVVAGQMGMSISVVTAPAAIALTWVTTKAAPFGTMVAKRDFHSLDALFARCLRQSLLVAIPAILAIWAASYWLHHVRSIWAHRILPPLPFGLLCVATICNHVVAAEATYLRAFKREPFLGLAMANGTLIGVLSYLLVRHYGATGMMAAYAAVTLFVGLVGGTVIFTRCKQRWQSPTMCGDD